MSSKKYQLNDQHNYIGVSNLSNKQMLSQDDNSYYSFLCEQEVKKAGFLGKFFGIGITNATLNSGILFAGIMVFIWVWIKYINISVIKEINTNFLESVILTLIGYIFGSKKE